MPRECATCSGGSARSESKRLQIDICCRVGEEALTLFKNLTVRDLMSRDVLSVEQNQKLATADDVMRLGRVRHVLVMDEEGALQGVVSQRDLFHGGLLRAFGYGTRAKQQALDSMLVKEAMRRTRSPRHPTLHFRALLARWRSTRFSETA